MAINATVDGVTYSGIDTINTGGKVIGLSADAGANYGPGLLDGTISDIYDSSITTIRSQACYSVTALKHINLTAVRTVSYGAFFNCHGLESVELPVVSRIESNAFQSCWKLVSVEFPSVERIGEQCFMACSSLNAVSAPACSIIGWRAFSGNANLTSVYMPAAEIIGKDSTNYTGGVFSGCRALESLAFPKASIIYENVFRDCYKLLSLYLEGGSVCMLSASDAFSSTPIAGYTASTGGVLGSIYVPASLLTAYQSATNWAFFSERFVGV